MLVDSMTYEQWLSWIEQCHSVEIELGLDRCKRVLSNLLESTLDCKVITIAGTNGKGSTVSVLEALAITSGKSVLAYTSPHFLDYRERLRFNGDWLTKQQHVELFESIEKARGCEPLTYFEYATLSAFKAAELLKPDLLILETGLGGRLDAVNAIKADLAIITTVDYDHQDWLGDDLDGIAREKAGIIHADKVAIIADPDFPKVIIDEIAQTTANLHLANRDFEHQDTVDSWNWKNNHHGKWNFDNLSFPHANASAAFHAWTLLYQSSAISETLFQNALNNIQLTARFERFSKNPEVILDVAHNPQAFRTQATLLEKEIIRNKTQSKTIYILGMLSDKNTEQSILAIKNQVDIWCLTELETTRGSSVNTLQQILLDLGIAKNKINCFSSPENAFKDACNMAAHDDRIVVTGSFYTVAPILKLLNALDSKQ